MNSEIKLRKAEIEDRDIIWEFFSSLSKEENRMGARNGRTDIRTLEL